MYEELETTCDRVALINNGHIVDIADMHALHNRSEKEFKIEFQTADDYNRFLTEKFEIIRRQEQYNQVTIHIPADATGMLLKTLNSYSVKFISEIPYTLEKHFKNILIKKQGDEKNV